MRIRLCRIGSSVSEDFRFVEALLVMAFPREERREMADLCSVVDSSPAFHCCLICDDDVAVGLITYWELEAFCFVEHFAILPELRGRGYGSAVMEYMREVMRCPIVLEAEHPVTEMARRRIAFYERLGVVRWRHEYWQPPYRVGDGLFPLCLMVWGEMEENEVNFERVRKAIYNKVYASLEIILLDL